MSPSGNTPRTAPELSLIWSSSFNFLVDSGQSYKHSGLLADQIPACVRTSDPRRPPPTVLGIGPTAAPDDAPPEDNAELCVRRMEYCESNHRLGGSFRQGVQTGPEVTHRVPWIVRPGRFMVWARSCGACLANRLPKPTGEQLTKSSVVRTRTVTPCASTSLDVGANAIVSSDEASCLDDPYAERAGSQGDRRRARDASPSRARRRLPGCRRRRPTGGRAACGGSRGR